MRRPAALPSGSSLAEAERYLLSLELFGMRFGLQRMRRLMTVLDSPQQRFDAIHVVGTNGKSSTVRMIAAILERHGLRTGAYLSPHLVSFTERLRIAERDTDAEEFAAAVRRAAHAAQLVDRTLGEDDRVTQFEATTAAAYSELARREVQVAVVEAGLGGRYDATNVLDRSRIQVLTNVGLEHTRWLGPTITDIAREKLDVVRPGSTLVLGAGLAPAATAVAEQIAAQRDTRIVRAPAESETSETDLPLLARGSFQRRNFALASCAAELYLDGCEPPLQISAEAVRAAGGATAVPGRFEVLDGDPMTVLDGAHNAGGIAALAESLEQLVAGRSLTAVVSILDDKDAAAMLALLKPICARIVFTACQNPRALSPGTLASLWRQMDGPAGAVEPDPHTALQLARSQAGGGVVVATGSIYLIADLLRGPGVPGGSTL